jgi:tyrosine-protein phosphatase YwqE
VLSFLKSLALPVPPPLTTDIHSHLLAAVDDGVKSTEQALAIIRVFQQAGYKKMITTPHVMQDYYRNDPSIILERLDELRKYLLEQGVAFEVQAAAEYYLDEALTKKIEDREPLLVFGDRYLLFETNMINEPYSLRDFIFKITTAGYKPVLAHPERYAYMTLEKAEDLRHRGVLFQMNILSIIGYYSKPIQRLAHQLIDRGWIELLGSDCHTIEHAQLLQQAQKNKYFQRALALPLLNHTL